MTMDNKVVELYYTQEEWDRLIDKCYPLPHERMKAKYPVLFTPVEKSIEFLRKGAIHEVVSVC